MSNHRQAERVTVQRDQIDDREAREMATFLVRIFGDEAPDVASERAEKSDQAQDWRRVEAEIERLLAEASTDEVERRPLRLFR
jgi:hypothetical protein